MLHLSSSEEVDVVSVDPSGLVAVGTRAEAKLQIVWLAEKQDIRPKSTAVSSGLQRVQFSVSTRKHSISGRLASSKVIRAVRAVGLYWSSASGR